MNGVPFKSCGAFAVGRWAAKNRRAVFGGVTGASFGLFLLGLWLCFYDAPHGLSLLTHGAMAVEYSLSCEKHVIMLCRVDKPSEAQIVAALPLLEATMHSKVSRDWVAVEGWGDLYYRREHGLYATESYNLSVEYQYVGSRLPNGPVIGVDRSVLIPLFEPLALFAILPGVWGLGKLRSHWRRRRRREGLCRACLYDLTGNASGVCPECGMVVPAKVP